MNDYVRLCPVCETENPAEASRCVCGALLTGVDFSLPRSAAAPESPAAAAPTEAGLACPHADCAMPNPAGTVRCMYCNRPLLPEPDAVVETLPLSPPLRHAPLPPTLAARFRVLNTFDARGSEADLMLVEPVAGGEPCVAKLYRQGMEPDTALLARLNDSHAAHVVRLLEHGVADGVAYEIMEYCRHGSLRQWLEGAPLGRERIRAMIAELVAALAEVHRLGILHRDLKPENVLVRSLDPLDLVLTDFGIASLRQATQHFTHAARTIHYAAPEALTGVLDEKADWWSLGMIVLEAASGRHPFDGLNEQVAGHQLATRAIDTSGVIDPELRTLCRGLLLRDPKRRWGEAEAQRWLAGDASLEPPAAEAVSSVVAHPYRIGDAECRSAVELAMAFARNWSTAVADLRHGSVDRWIEQELKDWDLARRVRAIVAGGGSDDRHLLEFMLEVAPNMPPVWLGTPLDRANLVAAAARAAENDRAARAWLDRIWRERVLELSARHGHAVLGEFGRRWRLAVERFQAVWAQARAAEKAWRLTPRSGDGAAVSPQPVDFDEVVYGRPLRMNPPEAVELHGELISMLASPGRLEALRGEIQAAQGELGEDCPWFALFAETARLDAVSALVAGRLLPMARDDADRERARREGLSQRRRGEAEQLRRSLGSRLQGLLDLARGDRFDPASIETLQATLDACQDSARQALANHDLDQIATGLRERMHNVIEQGYRLQSALHALAAEHDIDRIWLEPRRIGIAALLFLVAGSILGPWSWFLGGVVTSGAVAWRLRSRGRVRNRVRQEIRRLQSQTLAALGVLES